MPNKLNLRFRDPSTGQMHNIEGTVKQKVNKENPQSTEVFREDVHDGTIDLFVHEDKAKRSFWGASNTPDAYHVQLDTSQLTDEQAKALGEAIRNGETDSIGIGEGRSFNSVSIQTDLWTERSDLFGAAEPHNATTNLGADADQTFFLSNDGKFSTSVEGPQSLSDTAKALYAAAETTDSLPEGANIFTHNHVNLETREDAFDNIQGFLQEVRAGGLEGNEAIQARSSASTILTDLISSLGNRGPEGELKREAFAELHDLIQDETKGALRDSMIFNAIRLQSGLPTEESQMVDGLRTEIAPPTPPYDQWFKDGKTELNISLAAGHGEGFYEGMTELLEDEGFVIMDDGNRSSWNGEPRHLQLTREIDGKEYKVNLHLRDFNNDTFNEIDDPNFDIVAYQGHSNLGENTRNSIERAPDATGDGKLIFLGLCSGKDNLDRVRKAFPEAQLMTTFNSSYFHTRPVEGGRQFAGGEDAKAILSIIDGALEQASWRDISDDIRENAVGWNHEDRTLGNYISPLDLQVSGRLRDLDNDGSADFLDKHFNIDTVTVRPGVHSGLQPQAPPEGKINGELPHIAAISANTVDLYNPTYDEFSHKGRIVSDGYFKGQENDPIVRFDTRVENGKKMYVMQTNDQYSHISEEALRAITMVEYNRHLASTEESYPIQDPVKRELTGLLTAAASLTYDHGASYRDAAVFEGLCDHYNLPEGLKWSDAGRLIRDEHHDYTGSEKMAEKWLSQLDSETKALLQERFATE